MDEPVEPPFTPQASGRGTESKEKLVIEMPFNNDITFPIPLVPGETVGELRQRIGAIIGVEQSRVLISHTSPSLKSDLPVEAAAQDNKLQLVVRSSFDFERLRQLIEADSYLPVIPPPEPTEQMSLSPIQSPEGAHGFPWRGSSSLMSPRRRAAKKILRVKLDESMTLVVEEPLWIAENDGIAFSPAASELLQKVGFARPHQTLGQLAQEWWEAGQLRVMEYYRNWRERGLTQFLAVFCIIYTMTNVDALSSTFTLIAHGLLYLGGFIYLMCIFLNRPLNFGGFVEMPNIYHNSTDVEVLTARIPEEFRQNTDLDAKTQAKILASMRLRLSWYDTIKIAIVSLLPFPYANWERAVRVQEAAHIQAIKNMTNENIRKKEELELNQRQESSNSHSTPGNSLYFNQSGPDPEVMPSQSIGRSYSIPNQSNRGEEGFSYTSGADHNRPQHRTGVEPPVAPQSPNA